MQQLDEDLQATSEKPAYDHILMARCGTIAKADAVFELYKPYERHQPVLIHSRMKASEREAAKQKVKESTLQIHWCVDMFGEGFDLPNLKIAAFHDIRKGLAITLQFAGRFTRTHRDNNLGNATFIANTGEVAVREALKDLYKQNSDWSHLLPMLSQSAIQSEQDLAELLRAFPTASAQLSLQKHSHCSQHSDLPQL